MAASTSTSTIGSIAGDGAVTKTGAGTLVLAGTHAYTGATTVSAGTLRLTGSLAASSAVTFASGATLGGAGTIGGSVTAAAGASVAPGNLPAGVGGIGTLTVGSFTWTAGTTMAFELSNSDATSDKLAVTGALTKSGSGAFLFDFGGTGNGLGGSTTYTLMTFGSLAGFTAADFSSTNLAPGFAGALSVVGVTPCNSPWPRRR